ncbi:MAG TPA: TRAP transporter substrate-binding protein DctP [Xanthobacteraceae bacterium]|jgi:TRAP-type mannitol/chloroaromatic compound transport system substrate-binding protein
MERRAFLKSSALGAAALAAAAPAAPAIAQSRPDVKWRMASSYPKNLDILYGGGEMIARRVAALTEGKFQIGTFAAGELMPAFQVLDAVQNGTIECGASPSFFYVGKDPTFAFDTALPFGLTTRQQTAWMYEGGGIDLMRTFYKSYNVIQFPAGNTGAQMGGWFRKEINSLEDLKGLKMRVSGLGGQVMAKLGAVPQSIAPSDLYAALERGAIDAGEWIGPYDDERIGFVKVAKYYYYPGWWDPCAQSNLFVNQQQWDALPKPYQAALEAACAEAHNWIVAAYDARNPAALRRLVAAGAQLRPFPQEMVRQAEKVAFELYEEIAAKNEKFRAVYEPWKKFREDILLWFSVAELSLDSAIITTDQARRRAR